ncbi:inovirus-type Gp2 protein, partial [Escherichia coli]|nr:inovirus-type Gp2 protein [Escherichia coli]
VEESNKWVRQLFKKLRERLKSKTKRPEGVTSPINEFAFSWVRERHEVEKDHYHCWIALPHRQINRLGGRSYGVGSAIIDIWCQLTGGEHTLVHLAKKKDEYPNHYVIERGQPETLEGPIYWLSYLAKVRGKYQTGKYDRVHSTSQLRNRITRSRNN